MGADIQLCMATSMQPLWQAAVVPNFKDIPPSKEVLPKFTRCSKDTSRLLSVAGCAMTSELLLCVPLCALYQSWNLPERMWRQALKTVLVQVDSVCAKGRPQCNPIILTGRPCTEFAHQRWCEGRAGWRGLQRTGKIL
jgi:hypothetical protein